MKTDDETNAVMRCSGIGGTIKIDAVSVSFLRFSNHAKNGASVRSSIRVQPKEEYDRKEFEGLDIRQLYSPSSILCPMALEVPLRTCVASSKGHDQGFLWSQTCI